MATKKQIQGYLSLYTKLSKYQRKGKNKEKQEAAYHLQADQGQLVEQVQNVNIITKVGLGAEYTWTELSVL